MNDKYLFSGNRHESVPWALFLDNRLTPLERNAWLVIRRMLDADSVTALPTYEKLQPFLTSMPLAGKASTETVARALMMLRLTRWLSLVVRKRNKNGRVIGNVYILHDEPLSLYECLQVEPDYLILLCNAASHSSKAIQRVAMFILDELANDPHLSMKKLPTRLEILTERLQKLKTENLSTEPDSEVTKKDLLRNDENLNSESEAGLKNSNNNGLRNRKLLCSSNNKNILLQDIQSHLKLPEFFFKLTAIQQQTSLMALNPLKAYQQQQVLDEWQHRCDTMKIRNPAAYLNGIIQKAIKGELNILISTIPGNCDKNKSVIKQNIQNTLNPINPVDAQQAKRYLSEIKKMLRN